MPVTIGASGRAVTPLRPTGFVEVNGTRLEAKLVPSRTPTVEAGGAVVIVGSEAFGLLVRPACDVAHAGAIPGYGEPAPTPAEQCDLRHADEQQVWEDEQEETRRGLQTELMVFAVPLGMAFGAGFAFGGLEVGLLVAFAWVVVFVGAAVIPPMLTG